MRVNDCSERKILWALKKAGSFRHAAQKLGFFAANEKFTSKCLRVVMEHSELIEKYSYRSDVKNMAMNRKKLENLVN